MSVGEQIRWWNWIWHYRKPITVRFYLFEKVRNTQMQTKQRFNLNGYGTPTTPTTPLRIGRSSSPRKSPILIKFGTNIYIIGCNSLPKFQLIAEMSQVYRQLEHLRKSKVSKWSILWVLRCRATHDEKWIKWWRSITVIFY